MNIKSCFPHWVEQWRDRRINYQVPTARFNSHGENPKLLGRRGRCDVGRKKILRSKGVKAGQTNTNCGIIFLVPPVAVILCLSLNYSDDDEWCGIYRVEQKGEFTQPRVHLFDHPCTVSRAFLRRADSANSIFTGRSVEAVLDITLSVSEKNPNEPFRDF